MNHFEGYMMNRLYGDAEYTYQDTALTTGMVFVTRYLRMKHVLLFRLSNDVLQVSTPVHDERRD
jgi:polo-like kinase 1